MARLILVRHGETAWNSELRYIGQVDVSLNDVGRAQAEEVRRRLDGEKIELAYCSDLRRAVETAEIILQGRAVSLTKTSDLREAHMGIWQGLTYSEIKEQYGELFQARRNDPEDMAPPEGETFSQVATRVCAALVRIAKEHEDRTVLVVTHGGPIRVFLCSILGLPLSAGWNFRIDNCGITVVELYPEGTIITSLNDTCHLEDLRALMTGASDEN